MRCTIRVSFALVTGCLILWTAACKKSSNSNAGQANLTAPEFPLAVGDQWVYQVMDFLQNNTDTLTLSITGTQALPGGEKKYFCSITEDGVLVDSGAYTVDNDTVSYRGLNPNSYSYFGDFKFQFPFHSGSQWKGLYLGDTVRVISEIDSTDILGQQYRHVFSLKRAFALQGNYSMVQFMFVVPNIGVVNQSVDIFSGGPLQNQSFELISYKLE
jgi:hypothetical protein